MKVIICNKIYENDRNYFQIAWRIPFTELEAIGWKSVDQTEIKGKLIEFFMNKFGSIPKVLLFWNTNTFIQNNFNEIITNPWIKCIYMDDIHQKSRRIMNYRKTIINKFDFIFSTYAYTFDKFFKLPKEDKIVWYPHSVNNKFTVEFNKNPINKILLSGCQDKNVYPFREHMSILSKDYPIERLQHLSYKKENHKIYGHNYIKYLNKYIAAFTCCLNAESPYIVSKFFEIPASGALLLAYDEYVKEPMEKLGFIDGQNYIRINYDNSVEKIKFITDPTNRDKIDEIRMNGYNLVWSKHTLIERNNVIENAVNK